MLLAASFSFDLNGSRVDLEVQFNIPIAIDIRSH